MSDEEKKQNEEKEIVPRSQEDLSKIIDDMFGDIRRSLWSYPRELRDSWWGAPILWNRNPLTDLIDKGDHYEVHMDIPGISKDKLKIDVTANVAEIEGESVEEEQTGDKNYMMRERRTSSIRRKISFPEEVIPHKALAEVNDGVLVLNVPKKEPSPAEKKHRVEIK